MKTAEIITAVFGAGGIASLAILFKAWQVRRDGFNQARAQHIEDLARWRSELQDQVQELQDIVEKYRRRAASFEYQLRSNGIEPLYPDSPDDTPTSGIRAVSLTRPPT
ncbi:hypothetical protein ABZV77_11620 [Streptomyces sp. NPDC004732]|uniref:hypothetical protein n=1 Tax=Streptomyces sp. NPDC004732 TaxID=3154290 RepID=UPI0033BD7640